MCRGSTRGHAQSLQSSRENEWACSQAKAHKTYGGSGLIAPHFAKTGRKGGPPAQTGMKMSFFSLRPAAPLRSPPQQTNTRFAGDPGPTAVGSWSDTPLTQGLSIVSIVPASRDSERAWLTSAAPARRCTLAGDGAS